MRFAVKNLIKKIVLGTNKDKKKIENRVIIVFVEITFRGKWFFEFS